MTEYNYSDLRIKKSDTAIRDAFVELVLSERYDQIKVSDIITKAQVARSTFYQHYSGRDAILAKSLEAPMAILADSRQRNADIKRVTSILEHFWGNRSFCRLILTGIPQLSIH